MSGRCDSGCVMQIQPFSVNDGEGIRTTIFLCGCPLNCLWCCNPEHACYMDEGHRLTLDHIDRQIQRHALFYRRCQGGITFSGGEATCQQEFLRSLTEHFYDKGFSLALETCGLFCFDEISDILKKMDQIFYDIKLMDPALHRLFTGQDNTLILKNLERTARLNIPLVVRIPLILGVNAYEENIRSTCAFLKNHAPSAKLEFLPYHQLAEDKYRSLHLPDPDEKYRLLRLKTSAKLPAGFEWEERMQTPSDDLIRCYQKIAQDYGIQVISYR